VGGVADESLLPLRGRLKSIEHLVYRHGKARNLVVRVWDRNPLAQVDANRYGLLTNFFNRPERPTHGESDGHGDEGDQGRQRRRKPPRQAACSRIDLRERGRYVDPAWPTGWTATRKDSDRLPTGRLEMLRKLSDATRG
jgi:hypothetical protein